MVINVAQKYIFIHITKTAGNSVASQLKSYYPRKMFWLPKAEFGMHDTAIQIREKIGAERYDKYYKFAFVRNPWDRLYSLYTFLCQKTMHPEKGEKWDQEALKQRGFKHWLLQDEWWPPYEQKDDGLPHQKRDQSSWLTQADGTSIVNFVGRLEQLDTDFEQVCGNIGLAYTPPPKVNPSRHAHYKEAYDDTMIKFVEEYHWRDIERFNYKFE